jgi:hypothetical protein
MRRVPGRQPRTRILHHFHPYRNVADAYAKIDRRLPLPFRIPSINLGGARFQFERCCHPIARLKLIAPGLLAMLVQINESRGDH